MFVDYDDGKSGWPTFFQAYKLGMHRDGDAHVTFVSEHRGDVVIWLQGTTAAMAAINAWSELGLGDLSHAEHYGDPEEFNIIVNARSHKVVGDRISYSDVVVLDSGGSRRDLTIHRKCLNSVCSTPSLQVKKWNR